MNVGILITAAGPGHRLGTDIPKGLVEIEGIPLFVRTLRKFEGLDLQHSSVVVAPPEHLEIFQEVGAQCFPHVPLRVVPGGVERQISVEKGLKAFDDSVDLVAIHDAARPFVQEEDIRRVIDAAQETGAATLAARCIDTILEGDENGMLAATPDRNVMWACQTPQVFALSIVRAAHKRALDLGQTYTDDATLVRAAGHEVRLVASSAGNIKITTESDLAFADYLIREGIR